MNKANKKLIDIILSDAKNLQRERIPYYIQWLDKNGYLWDDDNDSLYGAFSMAFADLSGGESNTVFTAWISKKRARCDRKGGVK